MSGSPNCHLNGQQRRKSMYKTSPNWQQIYKKQCLSRLNDKRNESRSRLIDRFRNIDLNGDTNTAQQIDSHKNLIVDEVMQSVWNQFNSQLPPIESSDITDFMEQIRQELLSEESHYWEELIEWRLKEEDEWLIANRESVVCFFCQKSSLQINSLNDLKTQIFCTKCGFNFIAQERIDNIVAKHSSDCRNTSLKFDLINDCSNYGSNNILVSCDVCPFNDLIFKDFNYLTLTNHF